MKPLLSFAFAVSFLSSGGVLLAAGPVELTQPASPTKPAPKWLKIIDQGDNDPRLKGYKTPQGIKVEIVAEAPAVINPVGMTFAADGTPFVLEWLPSSGDEWRETSESFTYKDGSKRNVATMKKKVKDVVKVLRDSTGKGVYDEAKVILEDELPSSILLHDGWLYLSSRGTVRRYKQSKPGGPYDVKEVIAQGFCGFHHHQVSGLTIGNDGWLNITSGDDDNYVEGSDGSRATVLRTGAVFRCRPDGSKMHTFSLGYRNPYRDVAFDALGNIFHVDNDNEDGSKFTGCRLMHVAEGTDFGWRLRSGARCCSPDPVRGAVFGELPGKVAPMLKTGRGAPAGLLIYNDTRLPENYQGLLFYPDVFRKLIRAYKVERKGATFAVVEEFEFMKSDDPLFRPCQMVVGPDGAIYVVDWRTDSGGAGRLWGDGKNGRIYRISWSGTKEQPAIEPYGLDSWTKLVKLEDAELLKVLASPDATDRYQAQREITKRGDKNRAALLEMLTDTELPLTGRVAVLGVLQSMWNDKVQEGFERLLARNEPDLRRLAADGLGLNASRGDVDVHVALVKVLEDTTPSVRRAVALAISRVAGPGAADALAAAVGREESRDVYLFDGLSRAVEGLGQRGLERLIAVADSGVQTETDRVVEAWLGFRTRPAADKIPELLKNPHISSKQRAELVRSYGNYLLDPPISLEPLLDYLAANPNEGERVRLAAIEVLSLTGSFKTEKGSAWLLSQLPEEAPDLRLAVLKGIEDGRVVKAAPEVVRILSDAKQAVEVRRAAAKALRVLGDKSVVPVLKNSLADEDAALRLEAFRALAALDAAVAQESATSLLDSKDEALQTEAVVIMGADAAGTKLVAQRYLDKKLPRTLLPQVSEALRKHAGRDAELAKLLTEVMKSGLSVVNSPAEIERVRKLVASKGNAQRGRALYLNSKTLACINCHRLEGIGGNVGPDLTRVWETQSVEKLMESLIEPSKEIKEGYQAYQATTKKGKVYVGLKVAQTADEVVLREANGQDVRLPMTEIDVLIASKTSLMPDNVIAQLTYEQFIDLVAFLKDRKAQESLRGLALDFHVVGPFGDELKTEYGPEVMADLKFTYRGILPDVMNRWQPARAEPTGFLNLRAIYGKDKSSAYAQTYVYSAQEQKAAMLLGADATVRVWLNGKLVHEHATPRSARPDDDRVALTLQTGWNAVLVKVVNVEKDHGLYLRFVGEGLRVSSNPGDEKVFGPGK